MRSPGLQHPQIEYQTHILHDRNFPNHAIVILKFINYINYYYRLKWYTKTYTCYCPDSPYLQSTNKPTPQLPNCRQSIISNAYTVFIVMLIVFFVLYTHTHTHPLPNYTWIARSSIISAYVYINDAVLAD